MVSKKTAVFVVAAMFSMPMLGVFGLDGVVSTAQAGWQAHGGQVKEAAKCLAVWYAVKNCTKVALNWRASQPLLEGVEKPYRFSKEENSVEVGAAGVSVAAIRTDKEGWHNTGRLLVGTPAVSDIVGAAATYALWHVAQNAMNNRKS